MCFVENCNINTGVGFQQRVLKVSFSLGAREFLFI